MLLIASRFGEALRRSALSDLDHLDFVAEVALSHDHLAIFLKNNPVMSERKAKENSGEQAHIKTSLLSITDVGTRQHIDRAHKRVRFWNKENRLVKILILILYDG